MLCITGYLIAYLYLFSTDLTLSAIPPLNSRQSEMFLDIAKCILGEEWEVKSPKFRTLSYKKKKKHELYR